MAVALGLAALLTHVLKYQCCSERAALPGDLELKRTGARDLFKEPVGGGHGLFLKKNNPFCGFITLWAWLAAREKGALPSSEGCCEPSCFWQHLPVLTGFLCSNNSGMPFPLPPSHTGRSQTHKSSFPRVSPPCNIPGSCKPEGTAVSAVSHCCKCSSQGCSEDAEEEVCWVLNSGRSGAGRGCCSIHSAV